MIEKYLTSVSTSELIDELITSTRMRLDQRTGTYRGKIEGVGLVEIEPDEFLAEPYWSRKDPEYWTRQQRGVR